MNIHICNNMNIPIYSSSSSPSTSSAPSSPPYLKQQTIKSIETRQSPERQQLQQENNNNNNSNDQTNLRESQQDSSKPQDNDQNGDSKSKHADQSPPPPPPQTIEPTNNKEDFPQPDHQSSPTRQNSSSSSSGSSSPPSTTATTSPTSATTIPSLTTNTKTPTTTTTSSSTTITTIPAITSCPTSTTTTTSTATLTNSNSSTNSSSSNSIEQKRPMNAFLLFCQRQRSLVREQYPNLENRNITRILGDYWSKLDKEEKDHYTELARQHKEDFMKKNPDFKWCKTNTLTINNQNPTPNHHNSNTNNIHHNNNDNNSSYLNSNNKTDRATDCHNATTIRQNHKPFDSAHMTDIIGLNNCSNNLIGSGNINNKDTLTNRQHEAPKPPKKRFLERNDSNYAKNLTNPNSEPMHPMKDGIVPYLSLDQDTLNRVIDEAFSEKSNSPSGDNDSNMCKYPNNRILSSLSTKAITTNTIASISNPLNLNSTTNSTILSATTSSSYSSNSNNDEPVDYSMRTISATSQQIIDNLVERMLTGPDVVCSPSKPIQQNNTDSVMRQLGISRRETKSDET